jgi:hypothetical protein
MKCLQVHGEKPKIFLMCHATNGAHIELHWSYNELCEVQCLKIYRFSEWILRLRICNVLFHCHLKISTPCYIFIFHCTVKTESLNDLSVNRKKPDENMHIGTLMIWWMRRKECLMWKHADWFILITQLNAVWNYMLSCYPLHHGSELCPTTQIQNEPHLWQRKFPLCRTKNKHANATAIATDVYILYLQPVTSVWR